MSRLISLHDLRISFPGAGGPVNVLRDVSLTVEAGEFVGLVGESGSGKSMTALAVLGLLPPAAQIDGGRIELEGEDLLRFDDARMRTVRGNRIAMVFQEPMTALNPVLTIGYQIVEAIQAHSDLGRAEAQTRAEELLARVAIPTPASASRTTHINSRADSGNAR